MKKYKLKFYAVFLTSIFILHSPFCLEVLGQGSELADQRQMNFNNPPAGGSNGLSGIPSPWFSNQPGGWDYSAEAAAAGLTRPKTSTPNLFVTAIRVVDANDNPISPTPGVPFWVEIDWEYDNPVCANYTLMRVVNGWTNVAPAINWGCCQPPTSASSTRE